MEVALSILISFSANMLSISLLLVYAWHLVSFVLHYDTAALEPRLCVDFCFVVFKCFGDFVFVF